MKDYLKLFEVGVRGPEGPIRCRRCGRRFRKWHGVANHGLAHEREGGITITYEGTGLCTSRMVFWLRSFWAEASGMRTRP